MCSESQRQIEGKYALQSLIKVDEELLQGRDDRYRSVKSLHSNNEIENENDLFFFTPELLWRNLIIYVTPTNLVIMYWIDIIII